MQSLFDKLGSTATYVLGAIFFIVLLLVLLMMVRALLAGRVRSAGGRSRQPRLGVVDAFDLDRQRQLVLVRRDNVEHLIMIGGPNDVVVETAIVRAGEIRSDVRPRVGEDAPVANAPLAAPSAPVAPMSPPSLPVPPSVAAATPPSVPPLRSPTAAATPVAPPPPPPAGPRIAPPGGPSRLATAPPRPPGSPLPPPVRPIGTPMGPGVRSGMSPPAPSAPGGDGESTPRRFEFGRTLSRANLEPAKPADVPPSPAPEVKPPEATSEIDKIETKLDAPEASQAPASAPEQRPSGDQPKQGDPLDALEEEMAKLLGRPPEKQ